MDMKFPRGWSTQLRVMEIPGDGGRGRCPEAPWNGKSWELGVKLKKTFMGGINIF